MKVSNLINQKVTINSGFNGIFYYEGEFGGEFDYELLEKYDYEGVIVDVSGGRNVNVVVVVGEGDDKKYFELEDIEVLLGGKSLDEVVNDWDYENVVSVFKYDEECENGMLFDD